MGLDIFLQVDNQEELDADEQDFFYQHSLSRTFCNLMCRRNVVEGEPELDQIGRLTGLDISPLYDMMTDFTDEFLEEQLSLIDDDEERAQIVQRAEADKARITGNLGVVATLLDQLLHQVPLLNNLPSRLTNDGFDTLHSETYFADFTRNPGDGYIDNNFGQDLRNFRRFLAYAKDNGSTTVYFAFG